MLKPSLLSLLLFPVLVSAQDGYNPISVAVPFLNVSGSSHQMATGFMGVTASPRQAETAFTGNPSLLANGLHYLQGQRTHMNWMPGGDGRGTHFFTESLAYSNGRHAVGVFARVLEYREQKVPDNIGNTIGTASPREQSLQLNYAHWFPSGWSIGTGLRHVMSDMVSGFNVGGKDASVSHAFSADIGTHYRRFMQLDEKRGIGYGLGLCINNIGTKIGYLNDDRAYFQPTSAQLGGQLNTSVRFGSIRIEQDLGYQVLKLLVPTPPSYVKLKGPDGQPTNIDSLDMAGNRIILAGHDPNVGVFDGMIRSFYDAPGGAAEEWNEVNHIQSYCLRVLFNDNLAVTFKQGFHYQHRNKGGNTFLTFGGGVTFYGARVEAGGIVPTEANSALGGTFFIGVGYTVVFGGEGKKYRFPELPTTNSKVEG